MTPQEIRDHADGLIRDHARRVEFLSICESLEGKGLDDETYYRVCQEIDDLIRTAHVEVSFPESSTEESPSD